MLNGIETTVLNQAHDLIQKGSRPRLNPHWISDEVQDLVNGIVAQNIYDRLPILADALQEAGCDVDDWLEHLREAEPHPHGCYLIELLRPFTEREG